MIFEEALKELKAGRFVRMKGQKGYYHMHPVKNRLGRWDMRLYYTITKGEKGLTERIKEISVRFIAMYEWELVEELDI